MDNSNLTPKNLFWLLLDLLVAGIIVNLVFFVMPAIKNYSDSLTPARTLTVSAEGKAIASPDIAEASFSVVSQGRNPEQLGSENNSKMSAVIQNLKSQGIDEKDIKTTNYDLAPNYSYDKNTGRSYIYGYTLTQTILVKIRDLQKVAVVIAGLTPLGVNQIGGVSFTIDNPEKILTQAREDAFSKAQAKAKEMAAANGVSLGKIINIAEYQNMPAPYMNGRVSALGAGAVAAPTIEPSTQEVKVQISLTYTLK